MQAFWDPAVVKHFKPADPKYATEPDTSLPFERYCNHPRSTQADEA